MWIDISDLGTISVNFIRIINLINYYPFHVWMLSTIKSGNEINSPCETRFKAFITKLKKLVCVTYQVPTTNLTECNIFMDNLRSAM